MRSSSSLPSMLQVEVAEAQVEQLLVLGHVPHSDCGARARPHRARAATSPFSALSPRRVLASTLRA